jgi:hypothetical protein
MLESWRRMKLWDDLGLMDMVTWKLGRFQLGPVTKLAMPGRPDGHY